MLADFALNPSLFRLLWETDKWSEGIPADTVARSHLKLERHLNEQSARTALGIFKENIQFAGLKAGAHLADPLESEPNQSQSLKPEAEPARGITVQTQSVPPQHQQLPLVQTISGAPEVRMIGERLVISADVDLKGLRKLRKQLRMFETMLTMGDDDEEDAEQTDQWPPD